MSWYRGTTYTEPEVDDTILSYKPVSHYSASATPTAASGKGILGRAYQILFGTENTEQHAEPKDSDTLHDIFGARRERDTDFPYEDKIEDTLERIQFDYRPEGESYIPGRFPKKTFKKESRMVSCDENALLDLKQKLQTQNIELANVLHKVELESKHNKENLNYKQKYFDMHKEHTALREDNRKMADSYRELADKYYDLKIRFNKARLDSARGMSNDSEIRIKRLQERNEELELEVLKLRRSGDNDKLREELEDLKADKRRQERLLRERDDEIAMLRREQQLQKVAPTERPLSSSVRPSQPSPYNRRFGTLRQDHKPESTTEILFHYSDEPKKSYKV